MNTSEKIRLATEAQCFMEYMGCFEMDTNEQVADTLNWITKSIFEEDTNQLREIVRTFEFERENVMSNDYFGGADKIKFVSIIGRLNDLIDRIEADNPTIMFTIRKEQYLVGGEFIDAEEIETYSTKEEATERAKYLNRTQSEIWLVSPVKKGKGFAYTSFSVEATNSDGDLLDIDDVEIDLVELFKRTYPMKNHGIEITFEEDTRIFYDAHELTEPNGQLKSDILGIFKSVSSENDWSVDFKMLDYQFGVSLMDDDEIETFMAKAILNEA